jgi:Xaa-Pro aminopeptidase
MPNANCQANARGNELVAEIRAAIAHFYTMAYGHRDSRAAAWAAEIRGLLTAAAGSNRRLAVDRLDPAGFRALSGEGLYVGDGLEIAGRARLLKTDAEITLLQAAVRTAEAGIAAIQLALRPGLTENDALATLSRINLEAGGEWLESRLLTTGPRTRPLPSRP